MTSAFRILLRRIQSGAFPSLAAGEPCLHMGDRRVQVGTDTTPIELATVEGQAQAIQGAIAPLATQQSLSQISNRVAALEISDEQQSNFLATCATDAEVAAAIANAVTTADLKDLLTGNVREPKRMALSSQIASLTGRTQQEVAEFLEGDDLGQSNSLKDDVESLIAWGLESPNFDELKLGDLQALAAQACIQLYLGGVLGFLQEIENQIAFLAGNTPLANSVLVRQFAPDEWESGTWSAPGGFVFSKRLALDKLLIPREQTSHHYTFVCLTNTQTAFGYSSSPGAWRIKPVNNWTGALLDFWIANENTATSAALYKMAVGYLYASAPVELLAYAKNL